MEDMILTFMANHGWKLTLIALSGILLLGILKFFHIFDNLSKGKRNACYIGISTLYSIITAMIYLLAVGKCDAIKMCFLAGGIYMLNQAAYATYENYGVRALFRKIFNSIRNSFKHKKSGDDELIDDIGKGDEVDLIDDLPNR